ncbi:MAG TPA: hypothetical protein VKA08_13950 [Balneolales bacterium]|nr:hypothetical protein [Balneolales bacterium]
MITSVSRRSLSSSIAVLAGLFVLIPWQLSAQTFSPEVNSFIRVKTEFVYKGDIGFDSPKMFQRPFGL